MKTTSKKLHAWGRLVIFAVKSVQKLGNIAHITHRGRSLVLLKPSTFMNLSGKAVQYWLQKEHLPPERLLVVVDDLALPVGSIRLRAKGSDGGHNGLKDIQAQLQTTVYPRLRIGIGREFSRGKQIDYVLAPFEPEEQDLLQQAIEDATQAVGLFATQPIDRAMNAVNTPRPGEPQ